MKLDGYCPGCGGGAGNQGCPIARCSMERGGYRYCSECGQYPCSRYDGITEYDSFITHRNQLSDMNTARLIGLDAYHEMLAQKAAILKYFLEAFRGGRRKSYFCLAVNLLELQDLYAIQKQVEEQTSEAMPLKEKTAAAVRCFEAAAAQKGIVLKWNKKPSKKG